MEPTAPVAPTGGGEPAAPVAPVTPAAPFAPTTPVAPGTIPVAPVPPVKTAEETAAEADSKEWDAAEKDVFPGLKSTQKKEPLKTNPAEPVKTPEEIAREEALKSETPEQKIEREAKEAEEAAKVEKPNNAPANPRLAAREEAAQIESMKTDVRAKMFADVSTQLQDADGDPISSIEDVMKLINPRTGEVFTEEQAGIWLLSAQQQFNQGMAKTEKEIDSIAEVNSDVKYQADSVNAKYGEFLKANTDLRDKLWAQYEKTLVKDPASGVITSAPVSLEEFYDFQLGPRVESQQKAADATAAEAKAAADKEVADKVQAEKQRQQNRADRSDIYVPPTDPNAPEDKESKEWADAEKVVFGNQVK